MFRVYHLAVLLIFISCHRETYDYIPPVHSDDGWKVSTLQEEGFDVEAVTQALTLVAQGKNPYLDAIVVVRNGSIVLESYYNDYDRDKLHKSWSVTKSVTATIVGSLVDSRAMELDDSLHSYLGRYQRFRSEHIDKITIRHILSMSTGLAWDGDLSAQGEQLAFSSDMIRFALELPKAYDPGVVFNYNTSNSMLLAPVIYSVTGKQTGVYASEVLSKIGIEAYQWDTMSEFLTVTSGDEIPVDKPSFDFNKDYLFWTNTGTGLWLRPRDMAKIGQLYLDSGSWNGNRVLSKDWVANSTAEQIAGSDYGLHWKLMDISGFPCFYASGFGLQRIFVIPGLEMVIVLSQSWYRNQSRGHTIMMNMIERSLIPVNVNH